MANSPSAKKRAKQAE
ncbi:hypothetical protein ACI2KO_30730, partial [Pseudomonas piscis]